MKANAGAFCVTDRGATMGYMKDAFNPLPWIEASELNGNSSRSMETTHPEPKPSNRRHPTDFPRGSVARVVLIKPNPTMLRAQQIHICGRYRLVAVIDIPVMEEDSTTDDNASV